MPLNLVQPGLQVTSLFSDIKANASAQGSSGDGKSDAVTPTETRHLKLRSPVPITLHWPCYFSYQVSTEPSAVRTNMLELTDHHVEHLAIVASGKVIFVVLINAQLRLGTAIVVLEVF